MMTGAPNIGVTALRGMTMLPGMMQMMLHSSAMTAPQSIVAGSSTVWLDVPVSRRAMCGTASPMNATGPQNAVTTAVSMPVDMSIMRRVLRMLRPRFVA